MWALEVLEAKPRDGIGICPLHGPDCSNAMANKTALKPRRLCLALCGLSRTWSYPEFAHIQIVVLYCIVQKTV